MTTTAPGTTASTTTPVLRVESLDTVIHPAHGNPLHVLHDLHLRIDAGECPGVVGESGSGKSVLSRTILGIHGRGTRTTSTGHVRLHGDDILHLDTRRRATLPGTEIAMVHQDPMTSLNPVVRIADQVTEALTGRQRIRRRDRYRTAAELLAAVDVPDPHRKVRDIVAEPLDAHPDTARDVDRDARVRELLDAVGLSPDTFAERLPAQLSGGQAQRVAIARALAAEPHVLIADEAVSALDVSAQATVLNLLRRLTETLGLAGLFISHDLGVVRAVSDDVAVLYLGRVCEQGPTEDILAAPAHPYTAALLAAVPEPGRPLGDGHLLAVDPPSPLDPPSGCRFRTRCPYATRLCADAEPPMRTVGEQRTVACHHPLPPLSAPTTNTPRPPPPSSTRTDPPCPRPCATTTAPASATSTTTGPWSPTRTPASRPTNASPTCWAG
ncbi:ABC transporter ATP-binding protein (plasmid) [Embleya sp. NBC_00888]|uniref:ABC transporter ATP-binding protein n=1 Tax=Embleya sp. NBC_00888 TaxID=2975960 RepID=UPI002F9137D1|nr:ABC transporter ATP-binding protein [Embleya sp. NBC_00888]